MNTSKFNEDFFAGIREMEVWKRLSDDGNFNWSETMIERYQDKIDWKILSGNSNVQWSATLLEKYKNKIDWRVLSESGRQGLFSPENLRRFSSRWDWTALSSNSNVQWTTEKVEEFKDIIDWGAFIDIGWRIDIFSLDFFEQYKEYFPASLLQQSRLWDSIIDIYKDRLVEEILSQ